MQQKTIGIVGGGQLGRMLVLAGKKLGFTMIVLDPTPQSPAGQVADKQIIGSFTDVEKIKELAKEVDFLTFEIESANAAALIAIEKTGLPIHPAPKTLALVKDKLLQKEFFKKIYVPTAEFRSVIASERSERGNINEIASSACSVDMNVPSRNDEMKQEIISVAKEFGYPFLLKARLDAYDGRGNALVKTEADIDQAMQKLPGRALYVEKFVPFVKEIAVMIAKSTVGEMLTFPVVETTQKNNICTTVVVPAQILDTIRDAARSLAITVGEHLGGAGVFGIEMFVDANEKVLINEIAPRVHNSGHYTIEACNTSQFEQHIRAITGMELGSTELVVPAAAMVNILGERDGTAKPEGVEFAKEIAGVSVHIYGKAETKIERKMGHITAVGSSPQEALEKAQLARKYISI